MTHPQHRPMILVVADEPGLLDEVVAVLTAADYACRCCTAPEEAVAAAESPSPELIIWDANLYSQSGLDVSERIRRSKALAGVPVMFLSGAQVPDIIRRSDAPGATYHLRRPFAAGVLVELVGKALGRAYLIPSGTGRP